MSTDTEKDVDIPPSPFPDQLVYLWVSLLEGIVVFGLTFFTIGFFEGADLIPPFLAEFNLSVGILVLVTIVMFVYRLSKGGYIDLDNYLPTR